MCRIIYNKRGKLVGAQAPNGQPSKLFIDLKESNRTPKEVERSYLRAFTPDFLESPRSILDDVDVNGEPTLHAINTFEMLLRDEEAAPVASQQTSEVEDTYLYHSSQNKKNPLSSFNENQPMFTTKDDVGDEYKDYGPVFKYKLSKEAKIAQLENYEGKYGINLERHKESSNGMHPYPIDSALVENLKKEGVDVIIDDWGSYVVLNQNVIKDAQQTSEASETQDFTKLDQKMHGFLKMIGVDLSLVDEIDGNPDAIARANIARSIIEIAKDSRKVDTLTEESTHMLVDILEALSKSTKASKELKSLYRELVKKTKSSEEYRKITDTKHPQYDPQYFDKYSEEYEGEQLDNLLLKEAMAKNIVKNILRKEDNILKHSKDDASFWEKALNAFMELWNKIVRSMYSADPYTRAADIMFNKEYSEALTISREIKTAMKDTDSSGVSFEDTWMFQLEEDASKHANTLDKLKETRESFESKKVLAEEHGIKEKWIVEPGEDSVERYVGLDGTKYEGVVIKGRVSDEVKKYFHKKQSRYKQIETQEQKDIKESVAKIRMETGTAGHLTIQEIIEHHTTSKKHGGLSAIQKRSPFNSKQFNIISKEIGKLLKGAQATQNKINKKGSFTVIAEQLVHNPDKKYAGTIDLLIMYSDNTADIYDWKFVSPAMKRGDRGYVEKTSKGFNLVEDPFLVKMDTYHIQLSAYKKTLLDHYGVTQVRKSRIVPIHIRYKYDKNKKMITSKIDTIQMGSDMSAYLEHIPVADEMTDYESLNRVLKTQIHRRENIKRKMQDAKGPERENLNDRLKIVNMAIRKLQVKQDLGYVLTEANKALKKAEKRVSVDERRKADGNVNPEYLSNRELLDLYEDLKFYETLLKLEEFKEDKAFNKKIYEIKKAVGPIINSMATTVSQKLVQRGEEVAAAQGVRGLRTFNTQIGFGTANLVSLSKQSNPFMRTLWETMDSIRILKNRSTKELAAEIYEKQEALLAWGEANGYPGVNVYDKILNSETGSLWAKYSAEFWSLRKKALESDDHKWMKENYEIDEGYYKKEFARWQKNAYTRIEKTYEKSEWTKQKLLWNKKYDVKNYFKTASINNGGIYFLKVKESSTEKYMTSEYRDIQNTPELKSFYDFHIQKVREFSDMFGMKLSRGFTANVHADMMDVLIQKGFNMTNISEAFFDNLQIREHDVSLGKIDPNTGEPIRTIPKMYISELVDSHGNKDSSLKSKDLGKSLFLLGKAAMEYKYNTEVVDDMLLLETLLSDNLVTEIPRSNTSNILRDVNGKVQEVLNNSNSEIFSDFVNMYLYGQSLKTKDRSKNIFGRDISVNKTLLGLKQYHSTSMLALKAPVALGALGAGMISLQLQASKGIFITKGNLAAAQKALISADPKMRALVEYLDVYQDDKFGIVGNKLSADYRSKHMTNENWFIMLMSADRAIDAVASAAMTMNYGIDENGKVKRLSELPEGSKSIWDIMEFKENESWKKHAAIDRYTTEIKNLDDKGFRSIRNKIRAVSDKVKGTLSDDDKMRINSVLGGRLLLHYKSWLPGIAMERFGRTRYNYILEHFDEGTHNTFWSNFGKDITPEQALDQEVHMHNYLSAIGGDLLSVAMDVATFGMANSFKIKEGKAKLEFDKFLLEQEGNPEFEYESEEQKEALFEKFIELKRANMRAAIGEIRAVALLMLLIMMLGADWDDDGKVDIRQTWAGRKLYAVVNRIYRETAVIIDPREFMNSRSTSVPLVSLGTNLINVVANSLDEIRDLTVGEDSASDRSEFGYYTFKFFPGLNGVVKASEIYAQDKHAKF